MPSPGAGGGQAGLGALDDQLALELGERGEDAEDQLARRRGRVDRRPLAGQDPQARAAARELVDRVDEVAQVAPEPVELPRHQHVALPQRLEAGGEPRPVVALAGGQVLVEVLGLDPGGEQGVALQVEQLAAVGLRDAHVAEQHVTQTLD